MHSPTMVLLLVGVALNVALVGATLGRDWLARRRKAALPTVPPPKPTKPGRLVYDLAERSETRHFDHQAVWHVHGGEVDEKKVRMRLPPPEVVDAMMRQLVTLGDVLREPERFGLKRGHPIRYWAPVTMYRSAHLPPESTLNLFELREAD